MARERGDAVVVDAAGRRRSSGGAAGGAAAPTAWWRGVDWSDARFRRNHDDAMEVRKVVNGIMHQGMLPKDGKIIRINHSEHFIDKFLDALLKGSSFRQYTSYASALQGGRPCRILSISTIVGLMARGKGRDRVEIQIECTDMDNDLVMHRGKDMDMFRLERDFKVQSVWACGHP
ncbi:hypothetical protein Scep_026543 [Stephania cephalantha]|uniref:Uncharacterized protein n=1 Tax=Stephania cephalantha TaxID=152367 RepID=A0AAP0EKR3_9MAGN